ncbi:lysM and putative peptidoglycan-binding domain-containing protein 3 [Amyelois transitella]|uniref:lysM and putative peptidoglycan-binding domain-containing protein 3 n=1 Tax=Amyelois transitella TaxID=680683 RepID=UPI00298F8496|nr:lysM and putative peptidoglycan-binding domain-containing protein 3 [Amyelois transitella]
MKQRTRIMHGGDDVLAYNTGSSHNADLDNQNQIQLHKMKQPEHYIEAQVLEGDTLQAIALRFHSSISELKRVNHIHKDNEIFARRTIKVPVTPYSILTETLPMTIVNPVPSTSKETPKNSLFQDLNTNLHNRGNHSNILLNDSLTKGNNDCEIDYNKIVLNSKLAPSLIPYTDTELLEPVSEDTQLLPSNKNKESVETVVVKQLTSQGADFGLKWYHLLSCVLVLGVLIPIVYVLFFLEKPHELMQFHGSNNTNNILKNMT